MKPQEKGLHATLETPTSSSSTVPQPRSLVFRYAAYVSPNFLADKCHILRGDASTRIYIVVLCRTQFFYSTLYTTARDVFRSRVDHVKIIFWSPTRRYKMPLILCFRYSLRKRNLPESFNKTSRIGSTPSKFFRPHDHNILLYSIVYICRQTYTRVYYGKHYFICVLTEKRNKCAPDTKTAKQRCSASSTMRWRRSLATRKHFLGRFENPFRPLLFRYVCSTRGYPPLVDLL